MIVPGDIVQCEDGGIIPADGRLVTDEAFLQIDQSAITGESLAIDKHKGDTCYSSSAVKRGEAFMVVTATGDNTFVGRAATLVSSAASSTGHFTEVLNGIGIVLLVLVVFTLLAVWIGSFYRSNGIVLILKFTLSITVIGVPVGTCDSHANVSERLLWAFGLNDADGCRSSGCCDHHDGCRCCLSCQEASYCSKAFGH